MRARKGSTSIVVPSANLLLTGSAPHATVDEIAACLDAHLQRVLETYRPVAASFRVSKKSQRAQPPEAIRRLLLAGLKGDDPNARAWTERYLKDVARKTRGEFLRPIPPKKKPGPKPFVENADLVAEMAWLLQSGKAKSIREAARIVAPRAKGRSIVLVTKVDHLRRAFALRRKLGEV